MALGYLIFHLNLAFSAIPTQARPQVIRKCYWPALELAESTGIPIGVELTGWTLRQVHELDPDWVKHLAAMLRSGACELVGSGWTQCIGPLVPHEVNVWNQRLGLAAYADMLGARPELALVNELAFSSGLVDVYAEAGYAGIIMDRDNVRLALGLNGAPINAAPTHAVGVEGRELPVLWSDSILFQRLQRVVHGDIPMAEYLNYVRLRAARDGMPLPVYCNDVEIFDYRPGRFEAESRLHPEGEWERLRRVCARLTDELLMQWLSPGQALKRQEGTNAPRPARLSSISQPVPVKKQAKYNINRWAVTGRDNLWLNTACHRLRQAMSTVDTLPDDWRELCELWASDLRTHITQDRWDAAQERLASASARLDAPLPGGAREVPKATTDELPPDIRVEQDEEGLLWTITAPTACMVLNARRGLAITSLGFRSHGYTPLLGTLPQGYFSTIELGADFYSGGVLIEIPGERTRVTDLEWVTPELRMQGRELIVRTLVPLSRGSLCKIIRLDLESERLRIFYEFHDFPRPLGIVRVGIFTLLPEAVTLPLSVSCVNGGAKEETFVVDREVNHGQAASALVSSTAAFGATDGRLRISDASGRGLCFRWNPADCAASPMLKHLRAQDRHLTRLSFSLCELDDTSKPGGRLLPFEVELRPC